jgi:hypothetical protein
MRRLYHVLRHVLAKRTPSSGPLEIPVSKDNQMNENIGTMVYVIVPGSPRRRRAPPSDLQAYGFRQAPTSLLARRPADGVADHRPRRRTSRLGIRDLPAAGQGPPQASFVIGRRRLCSEIGSSVPAR